MKEINPDNIVEMVLSLNQEQVVMFNDLLLDADLLTQINPRASAKRFFKEQKRIHRGKVKRLLSYVASCEEEEIKGLLEAFFQEFMGCRTNHF